MHAAAFWISRIGDPFREFFRKKHDKLTFALQKKTKLKQYIELLMILIQYIYIVSNSAVLLGVKNFSTFWIYL